MSKAMTEKDRERGREDALALVGWVGYRNRYFLTISLSFFLAHISLIIHSSLHEEQKRGRKKLFPPKTPVYVFMSMCAGERFNVGAFVSVHVRK